MLAASGDSILVSASVLADIEKEARVASAPSPEVARQTEALAERLNEWPLLLSLVNGLLRGYLVTGETDYQSLAGTLQKTHSLLDREGLISGWRIDDLPAREHSLACVVAACLDPLDPATRDHYLDLAVFPPAEDIPIAAAAVLWDVNPAAAWAKCEVLARRALIDMDPARRTIRLHTALHDCLLNQLRAGELGALNTRLLEAYQRRSPHGWASGPDDGYYFQHLAGHLITAGRRADLQELLFNFDWLASYLECENCSTSRRADMYSLLGDFERALSSALDNQSAQLRLVQDALRLSAPALAKETKQLAPQLLGRLLPFNEPEIQGLVHQAAKWHSATWLRPLAACYTLPGGDEVRVLSGHTDWVTSIALLADGQHAVSSSLDGTLRLWDLANGQTQRVISVSQIEEEVSEIVSAVSGSPRYSRGQVNTGQLATPPSHEHLGGVTQVVVTPDGQKAITAGWDGSIRIWNLSNGLEERAISAHGEAIGALVITPDGKRVVSAGDDRLVRVWDLASGEQQFELAGHADLVRSLAVTPDGRTLVSGSWDYTMRLWDLDNGALMQLMTGHEGWVQA
ncbi:MAG: WD40 repeat domain-containing protein, partial [Chloroflexi bacterium]